MCALLFIAFLFSFQTQNALAYSDNTQAGQNAELTEDGLLEMIQLLQGLIKLYGQMLVELNSEPSVDLIVQEDNKANCEYFDASDNSVKRGEFIALKWQLDNVVSAYINNGIGSVAQSGQEIVPVYEDTTFTLSGESTSGDVSCYVDVKVSDELVSEYDEIRLDSDVRLVDSFTITNIISDSSDSNFEYKYQIYGHVNGMYLDIEPEYICRNPNDDCSGYLLDIVSDSGTSYKEVQADPYVKGGALYRFTEESNTITFRGYAPDTLREAAGSKIYSYMPGQIKLNFIVRENGQHLRSATEKVDAKG